MFAKILAWVRDWITKMLGQNTLKQALGVDVAVSAPMAEALQLWTLLYQNQAPWLSADVRSLNLAAAIAGEIARAVTIEMTVDVSGSARAEFLDEQLEYITPRLRQNVEYGCAKGGLMLKPYITPNRKIAVDYVQADQFYPVSFDANGRITACVFSDQRKIGQYWFTRLEYHTLTPEGAMISNAAFRSGSQGELGQSVPLTSVDAWAALSDQPATITGADRLLVGYFKFPQANSTDPTSPLGVSCYARAAMGNECLLKQADKQWSRLLWEFESGERALYVDVLAFGKDDAGKPLLPNKRLYRTLNQGGSVGDDALFKDWTPTFRETNILAGLDAILKKVEFNCGLAYGTISDPNVIAATATEIKMQKQRSYATITDTQKALQAALDDLLYAMNVWADAFGLAPAGAWEASYEFDDSIVADHDTAFAQDQQVVTMNAMPKYAFLMRNYGMSEEDARKWVEEAKNESPAPMDFFGQSTALVDNGQGNQEETQPAEEPAAQVE